jgi:hypothetical protein
MAAPAKKNASTSERRAVTWSALRSPTSGDAYKIAVLLTLEFKKKRRIWVGKCLELGTATFGDSLEAAKQELIDLTVIHLNGLEEAGLRERIFDARGVKVYKAIPPAAPGPDSDSTLVQAFEARAD